MSRTGTFLPEIFVASNTQRIAYCSDCKAPVVDDQPSWEAHQQRRHHKITNVVTKVHISGWDQVRGGGVR